ncbi:hypothetical protein [Pontibacter liquoris]|uniref:hypothetical protein n=1 Tax=Pontibacter liquoris TaxID=2905677 RepID=UPI001FA7E73A|nr:hypothetical protein [Pontibacter liquoris]
MSDKNILKSFKKKETQPASTAVFLQNTKRWLLLSILVLLLGGAANPAWETETITLRAERLPFSPKEFYVAAVQDERDEKAAVAYLLPVASAATAQVGTPRPVDLQGGGLAAIRQYIQKSLPADKKLRPIIIRLKEFKVTEKPGAKGRVDGNVAVGMTFDLQREEGPVELLAYKGGARYNRPASQRFDVEPVLRQSLADALTYLNTWMDKEAGRNAKLARSIEVSFIDYTQNGKDDTVFYRLDRPLNWNDFLAAPSKTSHFAASVFPGFAYEGKSTVVNGVIQLDLTMKVYVLKRSSWVKDVARNAYSLNHEQRHFDIVKIVAERFKKKVQPDNLTLEDYNSIIQYQYIESFREMNHLQEQYDGETQHGLDEAAQQRWNQRIDQEMHALGLK